MVCSKDTAINQNKHAGNMFENVGECNGESMIFDKFPDKIPYSLLRRFNKRTIDQTGGALYVFKKVKAVVTFSACR